MKKLVLTSAFVAALALTGCGGGGTPAPQGTKMDIDEAETLFSNLYDGMPSDLDPIAEVAYYDNENNFTATFKKVKYESSERKYLMGVEVVDGRYNYQGTIYTTCEFFDNISQLQTYHINYGLSETLEAISQYKMLQDEPQYGTSMTLDIYDMGDGMYKVSSTYSMVIEFIGGSTQVTSYTFDEHGFMLAFDQSTSMMGFSEVIHFTTTLRS